MLIEVDEYKKIAPNYDPEKSELFHRESARLADKDFIEQLKTGKYSEVVFMAGGAASGKTEFCVSYLMNDHQLVYDGTLKNFDGFKIKLSNIKRYAKNKPRIKVVLIIPEDWKQSFEIFLKRERKMEHVTFFDTHIRSKIAVALVLAETGVPVEVYVSHAVPNELCLTYEKLPIESRDGLKEKLILLAKELEKESKLQGFNIQTRYDIFNRHESKSNSERE